MFLSTLLLLLLLILCKFCYQKSIFFKIKIFNCSFFNNQQSTPLDLDHSLVGPTWSHFKPYDLRRHPNIWTVFVNIAGPQFVLLGFYVSFWEKEKENKWI